MIFLATRASTCRKVSARFLEDLLTRAPWCDKVHRAGVQIAGARIVGDIDLENAKLNRPIEIYISRIEGGITLRRARTDGLISLRGSVLSGVFDADSLHAERGLFLRAGAVLGSGVHLMNAIIGFVLGAVLVAAVSGLTQGS